MEGETRFRCGYCQHEEPCVGSAPRAALALVRCPACHRRDVDAITRFWTRVGLQGASIVLGSFVVGLLLYGEQRDLLALLLCAGLGLGAVTLVLHLAAQRFERLEAAVRFGPPSQGANSLQA